ncbi:MAG: hypothetical protein IT457_14240 [Planctomycetes bacterium]|nr:hypothetical protein [Planctomycetota bacterium]
MLLRLALLLAVIFGARALAHALGAALAVLVGAVLSLALCAVIGWLLQRRPVGEIGLVNRIAGAVLFPGIGISRGRLVPMVLWSAAAWTGVALAAALAVGASSAPTPTGAPLVAPDAAPGTLSWALLVVSWLLLGVALLRLCITLTWKPPPPSSLRAVLVMAALLGTSLVFALCGRHGLALAIAFGPVAFVLGGYGLMLLVVLIGGKRMRWN